MYNIRGIHWLIHMYEKEVIYMQEKDEHNTSHGVTPHIYWRKNVPLFLDGFLFSFSTGQWWRTNLLISRYNYQDVVISNFSMFGS